MLTRNSHIVAIMVILFTSSFIPFSYASVESEAQEDLLAGCRDDQSLVYRSTYLDFICVDPTTAERWAELGIAEIIQNSTFIENDESDTDVISYEEKYPGAPPPPPEKLSEVNYTSECRDGQVLIYQFSYKDTICTNMFTALTWEQLGMGEIVEIEISEKVIVDLDESISLEVGKINEQTLPVEDEQTLPVEDDVTDNSDSPKIHKIGDEIWAVIDYDRATSVFIEGSNGIIVIDSLNSFESNKKAIDEFKTISDKKIKSIVLTTISPEIASALHSFIIEGDSTVEIILREGLLHEFNDENDLEIKNSITYESEFSINVSDVKINLMSVKEFGLDQTYIELPNHDGLLVGNSEYGIFPFILNYDYLQFFNDA